MRRKKLSNFLGRPNYTTEMKNLDSSTKLSIFNSIVKGAKVMPLFFLGIHFVNIGLTGAEIGLLFAISEIVSIVTILPSGLGNDRFNSKNLITFSLLMMGIHLISLAYITSFPLLTISFLVAGIGHTLYRTSSQSLFYKDSQKINVSKKIGLFQSLGYLTTGLAIGLMGSLLNINITFANIFFVLGIIFLIFTVLAHKTLPENKTAKFSMLHYGRDIFKKEVIFFMLIIFMFSLHIGAETTSYGLFVKNYLGLNQLHTGLYMGGAIITMSLAAHLIGTKKNLNAKKVLIYGLLMSGLGLLLMVNKEIQTSFIFRVIHEIGDAAVFFFMFYGISKLFDLKRIGGNSSIFTLTMAFGATTGAMIFGPIGGTLGYEVAFFWGGITTLFALALTLPFTHLIDHK